MFDDPTAARKAVSGVQIGCLFPMVSDTTFG